jgi:anionic cell wall polymer biosynthesis LytR-Cps2A-Psr (LCP) family protein
MTAGYHLLNGVESLKFVRTRDFDGRGDIGRMERQQQFVSAIIRKATSSGTLLNPIKLANFYQATISTVKMDEGVSKNDLLTLGKQMSNLSSGSVRTLTVPLSNPNGRHPTVGSVVIWDEVLAPELWDRIKNDAALVDTVLPATDPSASASSKASPKATPTPTTIDKFKTQTAASNPCASKK